MRHILSAPALTAVALTAGAANAQQINDTYVSAKGSYGWMQNADVSGPDMKMNDGWGGNVAVGRYFAKNIRGEAELGYYTNGVDKVKVPAGDTGADGDVSALTGMLNGYYEPYADCRIKPYVGAGVGVANINLDGVTAGGAALADGDDTVLAGQVMAGASYALTPRTDLTAEYRYLQAADASIDTPAGSSDVSNKNHMAMVGVRVKF